MAYKARDALGLDNNTRKLIVDRLRRVALGPYWRYPTLRLNQVNWYAEVYSAATDATSDASYLQRDMRGQLVALIRSIRSPKPGTAGTLGPGMQFHYSPTHRRARSSMSTRPSTRTSSRRSTASTTARWPAACVRCRPPTRRCCGAG